MSGPRETVVLTPEQARRRRQRSMAIGVALAALVILFYAVSFVKGPAMVPGL